MFSPNDVYRGLPRWFYKTNHLACQVTALTECYFRNEIYLWNNSKNEQVSTLKTRHPAAIKTQRRSCVSRSASSTIYRRLQPLSEQLRQWKLCWNVTEEPGWVSRAGVCCLSPSCFSHCFTTCSSQLLRSNVFFFLLCKGLSLIFELHLM